MINHEFDDERKRYQDRIDELEQLLVEARASNPAPVMRAPDVEAAIAHASRAGVRQEVAPVVAELGRVRVLRLTFVGVVGALVGSSLMTGFLLATGAW